MITKISKLFSQLVDIIKRPKANQANLKYDFSRRSYILKMVEAFNKSAYAINRGISYSVKFSNENPDVAIISGMSSYLWYTSHFLKAFDNCRGMISFVDQPAIDKGLHRATKEELDTVLEWLIDSGCEQTIFIDQPA